MTRAKWLGLLCAVCVACGGGDKPPTEENPPPAEENPAQTGLQTGTNSVQATFDKRGGAMELEGAARLTIPSGALDQATDLRTQKLAEADLPVRVGGDFEVVGDPMEVTPHGLRLERPATIEQVVRAPGANADELRVLRLPNPESRRWEQLRDIEVVEAEGDGDGTLAGERRVRFEVDGFSFFVPVRVVPNGACTGLDEGDVCREAQGPCDAPEFCDGESDDCPPDEKHGPSQQCRPSAGTCDEAESCDGESDACPEDAVRSAGSVCRSGPQACDLSEVCDGESVDCPADVFEEQGVVCRASRGPCDVVEVCTGDAPGCPQDAFAGSDVTCDDGDECLAPVQCTGTKASCDPALPLQQGTACNDGKFCTLDDRCNLVGECIGTGDPCVAERDDTDANCSTSCTEGQQGPVCNGPDPAGTACVPQPCATGSCDGSGACAVEVECPVFVDQSAQAAADVTDCGTTWNDACATVQFGSDEAARRLSVPRVFVMASGSYSVSPGPTVLTMADGVEYYGGFTDVGQQTPEDRAPETYTQLARDGAQGGNGPLVVGASNTRFDGFEVAGGRAASGAGMVNVDVSNLTVVNTRFFQNTASSFSGGDAVGGAMLNDGVNTLDIQQVSFEQNAALGLGPTAGGAMYNVGSDAITLTDSQFVDNFAYGSGSSALGGGIYSSQVTNLTLVDTSFINNRVSSYFDNGRGGAVYNSQVSNLLVQGSDFDQNSASGYPQGTGGAVASLDSTSTYVDVQFTNNDVTVSYSGAGGGLWDFNSESELIGVRFEGNAVKGPEGTPMGALGGGYAVVAEGPLAPTLTDVVFVANSVQARGSDYPGRAQGAGLHAAFGLPEQSSLVIDGATFEGNVADGLFNSVAAQGGGAFVGGFGQLPTEHVPVTLTNVRFEGNRVSNTYPEPQGGGLAAVNADLTVLHADFVANQARGDFNTGGEGGGLYFAGTGDLTLTNVGFVANQAFPQSSGGGGNAGGGVYIADGDSQAPPAYTLTNVTLVQNVPDALFVATPDRVGAVYNTALDGSFAGTAPATDVATCAIAQGEQYQFSADGRAYLLPGVDTVCDAGDPDQAANAFDVDWATLSTELNGTLDTTPIDPGRHYDPVGELQIRSFEPTGNIGVTWDIVAPAGTTCTLSGEDGTFGDVSGAPLSIELDAAAIASGSGSIRHEYVSAELVCTSGGAVARATVPPVAG